MRSKESDSNRIDEKAAQFFDLLKDREGERHAVILQDYPDPDAIACGFAYRCLAEQHGIEVDLLYGGRISHQENLAMVHMLNIELHVWEAAEIPRGQYQGSVFVDNQGTTSCLLERLEKAEVPVLAIVDHHAPQNRLQPLFSDIRPAVGACASIFTHYMAAAAAGVGAVPMDAHPAYRFLATALMHGIISETRALIAAQAQDFTAAAHLQPDCDQDLLNEILHQKRSHRVMEVIRIALGNREIHAGFCLSGIGYLRAEDRDAIPQATDFLLSEETVHTAVVFGIVQKEQEGETIHGSLRTIKHALSPDQFLKETLGKMKDGSFYGGGKNSAGGFEIPLGFLSGPDEPALAKLKWETFNSKIYRRFLTKIGVDEP